jgi:hypothetical protein
MGAQQRKEADVESLLQWTFLDELPKRQTSAAEGIWDRLAQNGSLGGVNPDPGGSGNAQRYAQFGLPHCDAELIEIAVGQLGRAPFDWEAHFDLVAADLAALVTVNDIRARLRPPPEDPWSAVQVRPAPDGRGISSKVKRHGPRDVLMVNTVNLAALVTTHAVKRSRPDWRTEQMRCVPTLAERSALSKIIGKCKGKNLYTTGSYCPLRWEPSPVDVVLARSDYLMWHQALVALSESLKLTQHIALPPAANRAPWVEGEISAALFTQPPDRSSPLPLKPARKLTGAPAKKSRRFKGRRVEVDEGALP